MSYGQSFQVENWAVQLFAEEVVRGGPAFAVSLAISNIEPGLRNAAALGAWQVRVGCVTGGACDRHGLVRRLWLRARVPQDLLLSRVCTPHGGGVWLGVCAYCTCCVSRAA